MSLTLLALLVACTSAVRSPDEGGRDDTNVMSLLDSDYDSILDADEGTGDADSDGIPNYEDTDADGDGVDDSVEAGDADTATAPVDTDGDGDPDFLDLDSDANCLGDREEDGRDGLDTDGDGVLDFRDDDNDGDGLLDTVEADGCDAVDTDGDGDPDLVDLDADGDSVADADEAGPLGDAVDTDGDRLPDYRDTDADGDGWSDADERGDDAAPRDTDGDGDADFRDLDSDGDGLADTDEATEGTDPTVGDTDGDGYDDGAEVAWETDPTDGGDPAEGVWVVAPEGVEVYSDITHTPTPDKVDIAFVLDSTCSSEAATIALWSEFLTISEHLSDVIPDLAFGVAGFDDYAQLPFGSEGSDKPFYLVRPVTTDFDAVDAGLISMRTHSGGDAPESGFEALYQAATGAGYDQDCDVVYDSTTDVPPYISGAPLDVFSGGAAEAATYEEGGTIGGVGFREGALPILVFATDNFMRDPDAASRDYNGSPGGCHDATATDAALAFMDIGARFVGISVDRTSPAPQMETLARDVDSFIDADDDDHADEVPVMVWSGSYVEFRERLVDMISRVVLRPYAHVELAVIGDDHGFATRITPAAYEDVRAGAELYFDLRFHGEVAATIEDQVYRFTLELRGDDAVLRTIEVTVLVPGVGT